MAINALESCENSQWMPNSKGGDMNPCHLNKLNFDRDDILVATNRRVPKFRRIKEIRSPYVTSDRVQLVSRVTERKIIHKKAPDFKSSFPLAANIYKASSDEFKILKRCNNKKVKKSVLTLPNEQAPMPQSCTVSDVNEAEYVNLKDEQRDKPPIKKRLPNQRRKPRARNNKFEFYDRDALHCSQMNIDLDCSSTDTLKYYDGDGKRVGGRNAGQKRVNKENYMGSDVWTVLRNINRFQFKPSPHISEVSVVSPKVKKNKRRSKAKETRIFETRRTEEYAYIADFEVESKVDTPNITPSSSNDRITVINNGETKKTIVRTQVPYHRLSQKHLNQLIDRTCKNNFKPMAIKDKSPVTPALKPVQDRSRNKSIVKSTKLHPMDSSNCYENIQGTNGNDKTFKVNSKEPKTRLDELRTSEFVQECIQHHKRDKEKSPGDHIVDHTKVVSNGKDAIGSRIESLRKPRLVTTMPSAALMPKLTTTEIKRRLAHIKFPLVILGKDQVSSTIEVVDYNPPQFNGLNKQIWPFMVEWSNNNDKDKFGKRTVVFERNANHLKKTNNEMSPFRQKDRRNDIIQIKKRMDPRRGIQAVEINNVFAIQSNKAKPQLTDKMIKLLYKKTPAATDSTERYDNTEYCDQAAKTPTVVTHDASTEMEHKSKFEYKGYPTKANEVIAMCKKQNLFGYDTNKKLMNSRQPWSKGKLANEFIDNIISKISNGVYYKSQEDYIPRTRTRSPQKVRFSRTRSPQRTRNLHRTRSPQRSSPIRDICNVDIKETAIQTPVPTDYVTNKNKQPSPCLDVVTQISLDNMKDPFKAIPGFDDTPPELEIQTLSLNQIAVKHCMTNVVVQFDVVVPGEPQPLTLDVKKSYSCIPTSLTKPYIGAHECDSKILKCKTTIRNAILPAEICSVIPKIIHNFMDMFPLSPVTTNKKNFELSALSELRKCVNCEIPAILPFFISPELKKFQDGRFLSIPSCQLSKQKYIDRAVRKVRCNWSFVSEVLQQPIVKTVFSFEINPFGFMLNAMIANKSSNTLVPEVNDQSLSGQPNCSRICTALVPYSNSNTSMYPPIESFNFMKMVENFRADYSLHIKICIPSYISPLVSALEVVRKTNTAVVPYAAPPKTATIISINKFKIDSLFNGFLKRNSLGNKPALQISEIDETLPTKCIDNNGESCSNKLRKKINSVRVQSFNNKSRRRGFVRLYKRCKSTSNISGERSCTSLTKIMNLDDIFQALGAGRWLSSVFDGLLGQKLLSCIAEMKSWISEITPRQVLLVVLMTNKKETPNLLRFRPILLQGIAVNRITRATELDMEIEVIENENFKISQYDGIPFLPRAVLNNDTLLEELCWIAKTTASDYHRPFDESSEKLLKSLLEKRKKLNPSYLRVMARYVGLGLLKPTNRN